MKSIEILVNGDLSILTGAQNMHEAGIEAKKYVDKLAQNYAGDEITVLIDGEEMDKGFALDVRQVAKNMKAERIENKIMGDLDIC